MAYKIQYTPEDNSRYPQVRKSKPIHWKRWLFLAGILFGILWLRRSGIPDFLIPGDPEITSTAAKTMVENLQQGTTVNDAVTVFCKEILHGAGF